MRYEIFIKKGIMLLLAVVLVFNIVLPPVNNCVSAEGGYFNEEIGLLTSLGILPIGFDTAELDSSVGRHEITGYISRMTVSEISAISKNESETLNPDDTVSLSEVIEMLVSALNYNDQALFYGGYPQGHYITANDIGLFGGVSNLSDENVTKGVVIRMIYNALNTNYRQFSVVKGETRYTETDESYLEAVFNVTKHSGIVTGTKNTQLAEGNKNFGGKIIIGETTYELLLTGKVDTENMLGKQVYYYLQHEEGKDAAVIMIDEYKSYNIVVKVDAERILADTTKSTFSYLNDKDKNARITISENAVVLYNGKKTEISDLDDTDFVFENGDITLIENNGDGDVDFIIIDEYKTYVADGASLGIISLKYGTPNDDGSKLDFIKTGTIDNLTMLRNGIEITAEYIGEWDVLKVKMSKDRSAVVIDVFSKEIEGTIQSIEVTDSKEYFEVDGVRYEVDSIFTAAYKRFDFHAVQPVVGLAAAVILDSNNKIVGIKKSFYNLMNYGFLVDAKHSGLDNVQLKIYGMYGIMQVLDCADRVVVEQASKKNPNEIMSCFNGADGEFLPQLIMYRTNLDNKIVEIDIAQRTITPTGRGGYDPERFSLDDENLNPAPDPGWDQNHAFSTFMTKRNNTGIRYRIVPNEVAPVFYIPFDRTDDSQYMFFTATDSLMLFDTGNTHIQVFDVVRYAEGHEFGKASAIVLYQRPPDPNALVPYNINSVGEWMGNYDNYRGKIIVKDVRQVLDMNGETVWRLKGISIIAHQIEEFEGYFDDDVWNIDVKGINGSGGKRVKDLQEGDVIAIGYKNPKAGTLRINRFYVISSADTYGDMDLQVIYTAERSHFSSVLGEVAYVSNNEIVIKSGGDYTVLYMGGAYTRHYTYYTDTKTITPGNAKQVQKGNRIIYSNQLIIIVY